MREDFTDRAQRAAQSILDRTGFLSKIGIVSRLTTESAAATQIPYGEIQGRMANPVRSLIQSIPVKP